MCGRFSIFTPAETLKGRFNVLRTAEFMPTYNAAPTQSLPVIMNNEPMTIDLCRWGLIPWWAKEQKIGNKMINARAETLLQKPSFRDSFKQRRCLVLADGFYEWMKTSDQKIPYRISMRDNGPFAFAGIWDVWRTSEGKDLRSFSIITTEPNELMRPLHNRMPVILRKENEHRWLQDIEIQEAQTMLAPYSFDDLEAYPISTLVNSPRNNSEDVINPL